jgi:hypothetical protein
MSPHGTTIPGPPSHPISGADVRPGATALPAPAHPIEVRIPETTPPTPEPGDPGLLFFGAYRRSGTTWLTAMLNSHPEIHIRNEGWLLNDRGNSFDTWFNHQRFASWAESREAQGTWLRDLGADEAAAIMQRAMITALMREATRRDGWKQWPRLRWIGDKTTMFYSAGNGVGPDLLHRLFPPPRGRFLSMIRDGRDAIVSHAFLIFRERSFHQLPPDCSGHAMKAAAFYTEGHGPKVPLFNTAFLRHLVLGWVDCMYGARRVADLYAPRGEGPGFHEVKYEDVIANPAPELARIYRWLGVNADPALIDRIIHDNRFERITNGRPRGQEDPLAEWRKGIVGDWKNHFTDENKHDFKSIAGALLIERGYEQNMEW